MGAVSLIFINSALGGKAYPKLNHRICEVTPHVLQSKYTFSFQRNAAAILYKPYIDFRYVDKTPLFILLHYVKRFFVPNLRFEAISFTNAYQKVYEEIYTFHSESMCFDYLMQNYFDLAIGWRTGSEEYGNYEKIQNLTEKEKQKYELEIRQDFHQQYEHLIRY